MKTFTATIALVFLGTSCTAQWEEPTTFEASNMARSPSPIVPIIDRDAVTLGHASSKVYPPLGTTSTLSLDVGASLQTVENQVFTLQKTILLDVLKHHESVVVRSSPYTGTPIDIGTNDAWTDTSLVVDILAPEVEANDNLRINAHGLWDITGVTGGNPVALARIKVIEDFGGANAVFYPSDLAFMAEQQTILPYTLNVHHNITNTGRVKVILQYRSEDIMGGSDVATIAFLVSARLDVDVYKRGY
jgi:hypothetical protein